MYNFELNYSIFFPYCNPAVYMYKQTNVLQLHLVINLSYQLLNIEPLLRL